jgi:hypothetical protein
MTDSPICFGSRRNHHQGAVLCLAKTTEYGLLCSSGIDAVNVTAAYRPVVLAGGSHYATRSTTGRYAAITLTVSIPDEHKKPYSVVLAEHRTAP